MAAMAELHGVLDRAPLSRLYLPAPQSHRYSPRTTNPWHSLHLFRGLLLRMRHTGHSAQQRRAGCPVPRCFKTESALYALVGGVGGGWTGR